MGCRGDLQTEKFTKIPQKKSPVHAEEWSLTECATNAERWEVEGARRGKGREYVCVFLKA